MKSAAAAAAAAAADARGRFEMRARWGRATARPAIKLNARAKVLPLELNQCNYTHSGGKDASDYSVKRF